MLQARTQYDQDGRPTRQLGWAISLGPMGDVVVVPVESTHGGPWRQAGRVENGTRYVALTDENVYASAEEALNVARASVGLATISTPAQAFLSQETDARIRHAIEQDVRRELLPLVKRELLVEARELALADRIPFPKERTTMPRVTKDEIDTNNESSLLDKAKAVGTRAVSTVKSDTRKAAIRSFGRKLVAGAQKGLVKFLADKGVGPKARQPLVELVESTAGKAVIGYTLGTMGHLIPGMAGKPIIAEALEELRVEAESIGFDALFDGVGDYLFPDMFSTVAALEAAAGESDFAKAARAPVQDGAFVPTV